MLQNLTNINSQMQELADSAVTAAKDKFSISLDYSEKSLQNLELLLEQAHEGYKKSSSNGNSQNTSIENTVRVWGSYFGEVIRRSLGGDWISDKKENYIQLSSRRVDPLGQVRSRIVNGSLYNVQSYYLELQPSIPDNLEEKRETAVFSMKGVQDLLEVYYDRVTITPKGVLGFMNKGIKGTTEIPFTSIVAVQFKEAGEVFSGYLQFTIPGGIESRGGILAAAKDENTFMFAYKVNNPKAKEIKEYIDSSVRKLHKPQVTPPATNLSDELQKLASLKEQGVLTEEEFHAAKRKLIG